MVWQTARIAVGELVRLRLELEAAALQDGDVVACARELPRDRDTRRARPDDADAGADRRARGDTVGVFDHDTAARRIRTRLRPEIVEN